MYNLQHTAIKTRTEDELLKYLVVSNAGTTEANGTYWRTDEVENGKPVWRKEDSEALIKWWDDKCGWELYHAGDAGSCTYWTMRDSH